MDINFKSVRRVWGELFRLEFDCDGTDYSLHQNKNTLEALAGRLSAMSEGFKPEGEELTEDEAARLQNIDGALEVAQAKLAAIEEAIEEEEVSTYAPATVADLAE